MKVKRAHGVSCVYLPSWMSDQFKPGQRVIVITKGRKVTGRVTRSGKKILIILPHFIHENTDVTHVSAYWTSHRQH